MGNCFACLKSPSNSNQTTSNATIPLTSIQQDPEKISDLIRVDDGDTDELTTNLLGLRTNISYDSSNYKKSIIVLNGNPTSGLTDEKMMQSAKESQLADNAINKLFEEYKDSKEDSILSEGIERLCADLQYKPDEFPILVLAYCLDAMQMCCFTRHEFIQGLKQLQATTVPEIRQRLTQTIERLKTDHELFKQLYRFTFRFGLDSGHRILSIDMAVILWRLVFTVHQPDILERWLDFLEHDKGIRGIPKDTWWMFLNFAEQFNIKEYDDSEAWPSIFDDFVESERLKMKKELEGGTRDENSNLREEGEDVNSRDDRL